MALQACAHFARSGPAWICCLESVGKAWHPQHHEASGTEAKHTQTQGRIKLSIGVTTASTNL